jgi:hypothetical protein
MIEDEKEIGAAEGDGAPAEGEGTAEGTEGTEAGKAEGAAVEGAEGGKAKEVSKEKLIPASAVQERIDGLTATIYRLQGQVEQLSKGTPKNDENGKEEKPWTREELNALMEANWPGKEGANPKHLAFAIEHMSKLSAKSESDKSRQESKKENELERAKIQLDQVMAQLHKDFPDIKEPTSELFKAADSIMRTELPQGSNNFPAMHRLAVEAAYGRQMLKNKSSVKREAVHVEKERAKLGAAAGAAGAARPAAPDATRMTKLREEAENSSDPNDPAKLNWLREMNKSGAAFQGRSYKKD